MVLRCVAIDAVLPMVMSTCDCVIDVISIEPAPGEAHPAFSDESSAFSDVIVQDFLNLF